MQRERESITCKPTHFCIPYIRYLLHNVAVPIQFFIQIATYHKDDVVLQKYVTIHIFQYML